MRGDDSLPVQSVNSGLYLPLQEKKNWDLALFNFQKEQWVNFKMHVGVKADTCTGMHKET